MYQGLDVVIFGPLKLFWTQEKDKWLRGKRTKVDKTNFLRIYGAAHVRVLTPKNIKAAFSRTGAWPFNRLVVTAEMLAPSLESSCQAYLPVQPTTPVRAVTALIHGARKRAHTVMMSETDSTDDEALPSTPCCKNVFKTPVRMALQSLRTSSLSYLITSSPIQSTLDPHHLPLAQSHQLSPVV